jgi:choline kinase
MVLGYRADEVCRVLGARCHYIINERYAETNSLYSLMLARHWVRETFLVLNCDVLAHPHIFRQLLATPGNALAFDSHSGMEEEHMKVVFAHGQLQHISKALPAAASQGENVGLLKVESWSIEPFFREAQAALALEGDNQWAPAAVQRFALNWPMGGVDIASWPWIEIDFPEDLEAASRHVWPTIRPSFMPYQAVPMATIPVSTGVTA